MRWKGKGRRALSFLLALVLALSLLPASALAAGSVATVSGQPYRSIEDAWNAVPDGGTIDLTADCTISSRLILDSGKRITINMNGYKIDRGRTSGTRNGEVICVEKNASLTLTGGASKNIRITGWEPVNGTRDAALSIETGGLITGGWSTNGAGGIHMKEGASLTLDNVVVAGNRAERTWSADGYGGGVMMAGANGQVRLMNGAQISYNRAAYGGGLYIDQENCTVNMDKSKISYNYSENGGGGIYSYDLKTVINMTGGSEINYNSASWGGGIYFDYTQFLLKSSDATAAISFNEARSGKGGAIYMEHNRGALFIGDTNSGTVQGIRMAENHAASWGGALYIQQENIVVSNCIIVNNRSDDYGGGIYINNDDNTISSSTITNNTAKTAGGGVYIDSMNDITFSGKVIVENNERETGENKKDDVYPQSGTFTYTNILGTPSGKSRIGIRTEEPVETYVGSTEHYFIESAFFSDFDDYIIKMVDKGLKQVLGTKTPTAVENVDLPNLTNTNNYWNGEPLYKGYFSYPSVVESDEDLDAVFYYSDGYFLNADPTVYNEHLATMSMAMAMAGFYSSIGNDGSLQEKKEDKFPSDRTYTYKSQNIEKLLNDIGVTADKIYISNSNSVKPGTDTIGVAIGQKTIHPHNTTEAAKTYTLVPIAIRGAGYESEWYSNTTVGTSGEHEGFANAADQVFQQVQNYIRDYDLTDAVSQGKVKFWIAGYSRAGATANLTAKRLIEAYSGQNNQVYAYCFEAPKGGLNSAMELSAEKYYSIHNCINKADAVPLVAPEEMGFIRYGVDHYVPGDPTTTSTPSVNQNVWSYVSKQPWAKGYKTWYDNSSYKVGSDAYNDQRTEMLQQLASVDPVNIHFYDRFDMATINYLGSATGAYDLIGITPGNITQEEFGQVLMRSLLSWGLQQGTDFRGGYATSSPSFQQALQTVTKLLFGKNAAQLEGMMNAASGTMDRLSTSQLLNVYKDMIGNWTTLSQSKRDDYLQMLWDVVIEGKTVEGEYVAMYLTPAEKAELRSSWNVLMDVMLRFAEVDYNTASKNWNKSTTSDGKKTTTPILDGIRDTSGSGLSSETQAVLGTLAYNASALMQAHYPEINFAWLRSFDDFYTTTNETKHVEITTKTTPTVTSSISADGTTWTETTGGNYSGDQILKLTTGTDTPGAAIYYRLSTDGSYYGNWRPYNQPINLPAMEYDSSVERVISYHVQTTAVYCGNVADVTETIYSITQPITYTVKVNNQEIGKFKAGDTVTINGTPTDSNQVFKKWNDPTIQMGSSSTAPELTNNFDIVTTFTMPADNVYVRAEYATRISNPTLTVDKPVAGGTLPTTGTLSWTVNETAADGTTTQKTNTKENIPVYWLEQVDGKTQTASGTAKYGTKYSVAALVEQDVQKDLVFASNLTKDNAKVIYTGLTTEPENKVYQADVNAEGALRIFGDQVETDKAKVTSVPEQSVSIVKNSTPEQLNALLPKTVTLTTEDGTVTAPLTYENNALNSVTLGTEGTCTVNATIKYDGLNVDANEKTTAPVKVNVYANGVTVAPTASDTGDQLKKQVTLSCGTENAKIYYKLDGATDYTEYTTPIELTCPAGEKKTVIITAKATKDSLNDSSEVTFTYVLDNPFTVTINGKDTGTKGDKLWETAKTYTYHKGDTVTIAAPAEDDERFEKWVATEDSGITIDNEKATALTVDSIQNNITLTAVYNPVVNQLDLTLPAPAIGEKLGNKVTKAEATVTGKHDVTNLFSDIAWTPTLPTSGYPTYNTAYTAKLTLSSYEYNSREIKFFLADNLVMNVNEDNDITATAVQEENGYAVYVTFPATDKVALKSVEEPGDLYVERDKAIAGAWGLPATTTLTLADGTQKTANITWTPDTEKTFDRNNLETQALDFYGEVQLPENVERGNVPNSLLLTVFVAAAPQVAMPTSSLISGSYTGEQVLRLSCETSDAEIYYTLDGSDPVTNGTITGTKYDGGIITLPNSTAVTELHVIAVQDGMRNSMMAMYRYDVTRRSSGGSSKPDKPADDPSTGGSDYKNCKHDSTCPLTKFTDLDANAWYHDGVHYCLDSGLMAGYGNALFGPSDKLSRAQVVTVLWRMAKSPAPTAANAFTDVPADTWYTDAVRWAAENGVVGGYGDGRFGPNDPVTREQMAAMFYRFAKQQGRDVTQRADLGTYADAASVSDWAKEALQWACGAGLINGMDGSLVPQGTATRAQTAAVLQRLSALTK